MFSERLKLARKRSGLSLRALSSAMGGIVSAQAIGKYERTEMMPSSTVAIALADALEVPPSYLWSPSRVSLESVEFRKLASTKAKDRAAVEGEVLDHVDRYLQVEEILGLDVAEQDGLGGAPYRITAVEDVERAATSVRAAWNLGVGPIPDMTELLEERGIKVFKWEFARVGGWAQLSGAPGPRGRRSRRGLLHREVFRKTAVHDCSRTRPPSPGNPVHGSGRKSLPTLCRCVPGTRERAYP